MTFIKRRRSLLVLCLVAALTAIATGLAPAAAEASNRCTRYFGFPTGVWNSSSCASVTTYQQKGTDGVWQETDSTAQRDTNSINANSSVCAPLRLRLQYSNGNGATSSTGCVTGWFWGSGSGGFAKSQCRVSHDSAQWVIIYIECTTQWTA